MRLPPKIGTIFDATMVAFIVAMVVTLFSSINTIRYVYIMQQDLRSWYERDLVGQSSIQIARVNLLSMDRNNTAILLTADPGRRERLRAVIRRERESFIRQMAQARSLFTAGKSKKLMERAFDQGVLYLNLLDEAVIINENRPVPAVGTGQERLSAAFNDIDAILHKLDDLKQEKDLRVYRSIIAQHEVTMGLAGLILFGSIAARVVMLVVDRRKRRSSATAADRRQPNMDDRQSKG